MLRTLRNRWLSSAGERLLRRSAVHETHLLKQFEKQRRRHNGVPLFGSERHQVLDVQVLKAPPVICKQGWLFPGHASLGLTHRRVTAGAEQSYGCPPCRVCLPPEPAPKQGSALLGNSIKKSRTPRRWEQCWGHCREEERACHSTGEPLHSVCHVLDILAAGSGSALSRLLSFLPSRKHLNPSVLVPPGYWPCPTSPRCVFSYPSPT